MQPDDQSTEAQRSGVDEENTITTFEEAFERIKEATGVTNTQVPHRDPIQPTYCLVRMPCLCESPAVLFFPSRRWWSASSRRETPSATWSC